LCPAFRPPDRRRNLPFKPRLRTALQLGYRHSAAIGELDREANIALGKNTMRQTALAILAAFGAMSSGCEKPAEKTAPPPPAAAAENPAAENAAPAPAAPPAAAENPARQNLNQRLVTTIVDSRKALAENPNLVVKEKNEFKANDPITYVSKGYFSGVSTLTMAALKHEVELMKNLDDNFKYPTFEQFDGMLKRNNVKLNGLYRWQVYGYDSTDGAIVILEDPELKKAEYEKAGLDPNTAP